MRHPELWGALADLLCMLVLLAWRASFGVLERSLRAVSAPPGASSAAEFLPPDSSFSGSSNVGNNNNNNKVILDSLLDTHGWSWQAVAAFLSSLSPSEFDFADCLATCTADVFWLAGLRLVLLAVFYVVLPLGLFCCFGGGIAAAADEDGARRGSRRWELEQEESGTVRRFVRSAGGTPVAAGVLFGVSAALLLLKLAFFSPLLGERDRAREPPWQDWVVIVAGIPIAFLSLLPRLLRRICCCSACCSRSHRRMSVEDDKDGLLPDGFDPHSGYSDDDGPDNFDGTRSIVGKLKSLLAPPDTPEEYYYGSGSSGRGTPQFGSINSREEALARLSESPFFRENSLDRGRATGEIRESLVEQERVVVSSPPVVAEPADDSRSARSAGPTVLPSFPRLSSMLLDPDLGIPTVDKRAAPGFASSLSSAFGGRPTESRREELLERCFSGQDLCDWLWQQLGRETLGSGVTRVQSSQAGLLGHRSETLEVAQRLVDMGYVESVGPAGRDAPFLDSPSVYYGVHSGARSTRMVMASGTSGIPVDHSPGDRRVAFSPKVEVLSLSRRSSPVLDPKSNHGSDKLAAGVGGGSKESGAAPPVGTDITPSVLGPAKGSAATPKPEQLTAHEPLHVPPGRPQLAAKLSPNLLNFVRDMQLGVPVRDRVVYLTSTNYSTLSGVFTGEDAVSWVMEEKQMAEREHATKVLSRLAATGVFRRVDQPDSLTQPSIDSPEPSYDIKDSPDAWYQFAREDTATVVH